MGALIISLDDSQLIALINAADRRLFFAAPGMSLPVAEAICLCWSKMGPDGVQVIVDAEPEICRLGYGSVEALRVLHDTANKLGSAILHRPGIRICILISDDTTLVFSPTPLLIEGGSTQFPHTNGIRFEGRSGVHPDSPSNPLQAGAQDLIQEGEQVNGSRLERVEKDLAANPPQKFDLAQKVTVFNAQLEFVELELKGFSISKKTVPIPSDLMGLARDEKTQDLLRSTFKLIGKGTEVSEKPVMKLKHKIVKRYLIGLGAYGNVVLRANKPAFEEAVEDLKKSIEEFQKLVREKLQKEMDANRAVLLAALAPSVTANPPGRWTNVLGPHPSEVAVRGRLEKELAKNFGSVDHLIHGMKVKLVFKGVTYELLRDPDFIETAQEKIPDLKFLHEEFDAAKASKPGRSPRTPAV
jgi:hypothetical protein